MSTNLHNHTKQIRISKKLHQQIKILAAERGTSMGHLTATLFAMGLESENANSCLGKEENEKGSENPIAKKCNIIELN